MDTAMESERFKSNHTMINVTKTFLPPMSEYTRLLQDVWKSAHVTNHGPLVVRLERALAERLGARHCFFVGNGTLALQIAIKALELRGQIITTPFSYVATTSSIVWEGCQPVFVDIQPDTLTLDPALIEAAITQDTRAILATHVYGNPCDVDEIARIAAKNSLRVIYDGAHAFDIAYQGKPISSFGDITTFSFHATKLFHTVEGGAITCEDDALAHRISYLRNFGHNGPEGFWGLGINGKNSEFHAAMGLCVLPYVDGIIDERRVLSTRYDERLKRSPAIRRPMIRPGTRYNYAYHAVLFQSEAVLLEARDALNRHDIFPRRYFYPDLSQLPYVASQRMPVGASVAERVLCLPLYAGLPTDAVDAISDIVLAVVEGR